MSRMQRVLVICVASGLAIALLLIVQTGPDERTPSPAFADDSAEPLSPWQLLVETSAEPNLERSTPGSGFEQLDEHLVHPVRTRMEAPAPGRQLELATGPGSNNSYTVIGRFRHANGDISIHARGSGLEDRAILTYGTHGLFARVSGADGLYLVHSDHSGSWLIDLNDTRLEVDPLHDDTLGQPTLHPLAAGTSQQLNAAEHTSATLAELASTHGSQGLSQIDVMFIYTPDMLSRYPGGLIETRLNHLVAIANQTLVDSQVPIAVRLVHHRSVNYTSNRDNRSTLIELRAAMAGQPVPGFEGVRQAREQHGADIVALTWPHDIETRGSCGIAFFPVIGSSGADPSYGVHIDNDGASNWSVCSDAVFTHELGHNLNAEHQRSQSSGDDPERSNYAFIELDRFHTIMGSFGTGHTNRYLRLDLFSNPRIQCGGAACGSTSIGRGSDNAAEITRLGPVIANYQFAATPGTVTRPPPSNPDSDGDGIPDASDPYPFDPFNGQPPEESTAPFVFSERLLRSGAEAEDWELLVTSTGSDQVLAFSPEGQLLSIVSRPESINPGPVLSDFSDMAVDADGRLYLLANGDVRRYDRLSGQLIDVFLDAARPEPADLQSPFPRALGFISESQLVVLGDDAIERYDAQRRRLNFPQNPVATSEPSHWNDRLELSLRAMVEWQNSLFITEATQNRILRFDTTNGIRRANIVGPDNPWISDPWDMALDNDGLLYLANGAAGNVLRFDIDSNGFLDEFIPAGSQGLAFARALAFGPDGDLYVACRESNRILRFDGQTGEPRGVAVEAGQAGLKAPSSLLFARRVNEVHSGHSGAFFIPDRAGEGWLVEVLDDERVSINWFSFPPESGPDLSDAEQAWLLGVGEIDGNRVEFDQVLRTAGQGFGRHFDPDSLALIQWGEISLEFANCDSARLTYRGPEGWGEGSHRISRVIGIPGLPCGSEGLAASPDRPGISGQWLEPATSGQGWLLQEIEPGRVFVSWYSYDETGRQVWLIGDSGRFEGRDLVFDDMLVSRGTFFGESFRAEAVELERWGHLRFSFSDCEQAIVDYESSLPGFGSGRLFAERLTQPGNLDCQLP